MDESLTYLQKIDPARNERKYWSCRFMPSQFRPGGIALEVAWGRIGTKGDSKVFDEGFVNDAQILEEAAMRTRDKMREGYLDETDRFKLLAAKVQGGIVDTGAVNADGWPIDETGREQRPTFDRTRTRRPVVRAGMSIPLRPMRDTVSTLRERMAAARPAPDTIPMKSAAQFVAEVKAETRAPRRLVEVVTLVTERIIDFEE